MPYRLRAILLIGAFISAFPAFALEDSRHLLAQPTTCSKAWLAQYCARRCDEASTCREAIVDHRLEQNDCMSEPLQAAQKIRRGCDACGQVFCR